MLVRYLNWKFVFVLLAVIITLTALYYANILTRQLGIEEQKKVEVFASSIRSLSKAKTDEEQNLPMQILSSNTTIPIILTDKNKNVLDINNIGIENISETQKQQKIIEFQSQHQPIKVNLTDSNFQYVFYGESQLMKQLRYFPYVLLGILFVFLLLVISFLNSSNKYVQDKVWVGMSKETAHQLGTPISSLEAWLQLLKDKYGESELTQEMQNDINRLELIAERFSKIGSVPELKKQLIDVRVERAIDYIKKRSSKNINISFENKLAQPTEVSINAPLFDWVTENLMRNALDALGGKGFLKITLHETLKEIKIDFEDNGYGIASKNFNRVFKPGFSTKKRGWGLGLSLAKRIIEDYHHGELFVKWSEVGKGTCIRIGLKK
ncbi:MAG: HAMP domain-containing histidine kinase [Chitinophagaceae bacterium]|nr:HAMP domain-containing histidine kinase [Chitinophagaceae bacterium]